jgi:DNA polymerase-3 subunit epsilon
LETTGAHPAWSRVTEIAVVEVNEGDVVSEWSTLLNPGTTIPAPIQALTGITNEMVADAPAFDDIAQEIYERLEGRVFVAHNARFDYGFLRHEFERVGLRFHARTLCTVKLSRRLYPDHRRHSLDSLIERHGIELGTSGAGRHRALGDARAVWDFLRIAENEQGMARLQEIARDLSKLPALPPQIERAAVDAIPEGPGVYLFYGEGDALLYVGKSVAMRSRVLQHFSGDLNSAREQQIARELRRIEWRRTCGELGALLLEARLVKTLHPALNRQLKDSKGLCGFSFDSTRLNLEENENINSETLPLLHGIFRSRRSALAALRGLAAEHGLCLQTLGFERARKGACFHHQIQRCAGVCAGRESPHQHLARVGAALARLKLPAWPWRGPVGVIEHDAERDATEVHVVDQWCWLGTAQNDTEVAELLDGARRARFDLDHFRIFTRHLGGSRAQVVELRVELPAELRARA